MATGAGAAAVFLESRLSRPPHGEILNRSQIWVMGGKLNRAWAGIRKAAAMEGDDLPLAGTSGAWPAWPSRWVGHDERRF